MGKGSTRKEEDKKGVRPPSSYLSVASAANKKKNPSSPRSLVTSIAFSSSLTCYYDTYGCTECWSIHGMMRERRKALHSPHCHRPTQWEKEEERGWGSFFFFLSFPAAFFPPEVIHAGLLPTVSPLPDQHTARRNFDALHRPNIQ